MSNQQPEHIDQEDLKLINDLSAALQSEKHTGYFAVISLFLSFVIVFIVWAYFSPLEEVAQGQGRIIPSSREQIVQSLDPDDFSKQKNPRRRTWRHGYFHDCLSAQKRRGGCRV